MTNEPNRAGRSEDDLPIPGEAVTPPDTGVAREDTGEPEAEGSANETNVATAPAAELAAEQTVEPASEDLDSDASEDLDPQEVTTDAAAEASDEDRKAEASQDDDTLFVEEDPPEPTDAQRITQLEEKLLAAESASNALKGRLLRTAADYENFRKRSDREKEDLRKYGANKVVTDFLPIVDNLERAIAHGEKGDEASGGLADGVRMVLRQFATQLEKFGVKGFDSLDEIFDPEKHEAVQQVEREDVPTNTVVEEFQRGYFIHDRLLRPAMVVVAKNPND